MFCLDTNIWSYLMRRPPDALALRLAACRKEEICLSEMTRAELLFGAARSSRPEILTQTIIRLLAPYRCLAFGGIAVEHHAAIRLALEKAGNPINSNDLIIAATARAAGMVMVTANLDEFARVPGLICEDWTK